MHIMECGFSWQWCLVWWLVALPGNFQPLIPQWEPSSGEIESCLFALQAAAGGILVGSVFGYWVGLKKKA